MYTERGSLLLLPIRKRRKKGGGLPFLTSFLQSSYSHFCAMANAMPRFFTLPGMWRGDVLPFSRLAKKWFYFSSSATSAVLGKSCLFHATADGSTSEVYYRIEHIAAAATAKNGVCLTLRCNLQPHSNSRS